jgi:hypothetical protein
MNFKTENVSVGGTSLQGYLEVNYSDLCEVFGMPNPENCDNYKTDAEWNIQFSDGTIATIYNYKDGKNYCGEDGLDVEDIKEWHVGGHGTSAFQMVELAMESHFINE